MNPLLLVFAFADLIVSAQVRLNAVILGQPVSVPVLWLVAAVVSLTPRRMGNRRVIPYVLGSWPKLC